MHSDEADPKGLIRESYRIEGITAAECRSIFIDWALSLPVAADLPEAIEALLARYEPANPGHPMADVLREGLVPAAAPQRRGGRAGRISAAAPPPRPQDG
jgi:hypothetical protein